MEEELSLEIQEKLAFCKLNLHLLECKDIDFLYTLLTSKQTNQN